MRAKYQDLLLVGVTLQISVSPLGAEAMRG